MKSMRSGIIEEVPVLKRLAIAPECVAALTKGDRNPVLPGIKSNRQSRWTASQNGDALRSADGGFRIALE